MIHISLPRGQAGWLVYNPRSLAIRVCADVIFDETFQTVVLRLILPFPTQYQSIHHDPGT